MPIRESSVRRRSRGKLVVASDEASSIRSSMPALAAVIFRVPPLMNSPATTVLAGKLLYNLALVFTVEIVTVPLFFVFMPVASIKVGLLIAALIAGGWGLAASSRSESSRRLRTRSTSSGAKVGRSATSVKISQERSKFGRVQASVNPE